MLLGLVVGSVGGCGEEVEEVGSADLGVLTCPPGMFPFPELGFGTQQGG